MAIKAKEKYRLSTGEVVPGVTTIIGGLGWNKQVLIYWANNLGLNGQDSKKYVDDKAFIGTLAHSFVLAELKGEKPDTSDYTANQIKQAQNCLKSYQNWKKNKKITPILVEKMLVHEELRFGGTPDFYGTIDDILTLVDYKTGKGGIYAEYKIQVSAYAKLIELTGNEIKEVRILNIPRSDDEVFSEKIITSIELSAGWTIFKHLKGIFDLKNALKKE